MTRLPPQPRGADIYVGDLDPSVTEAVLLEHFQAAGKVTYIRLNRHFATRHSQGYGYVNYATVAEAQKAVDTLNHKVILGPTGQGRECRVAFKTPRDPKRDNTQPGEVSGNLYVKNLPAEMDSASMHDFFSTYGNVLSCKVAKNKEGESLRYGFVQFDDPKKSTDAIQQCSGKNIGAAEADASGKPAKPLMVEFFKPRSSRTDTSGGRWTNLFVKNIGEADEGQLRSLGADFGTVTSVHVRKGPRSGARGAKQDGNPDEIVPYGFGFINFSTHEEALKAREGLPKKAPYGTPLEVNEAVNKKRRKEQLRVMSKDQNNRLIRDHPHCNVYIKNLAEDVTREMLAQEVQRCALNGPLLSCAVMLEKSEFQSGKFVRPGASKGFAFVCFSTPEDALRAVNMLGRHTFHGKSLHVEVAVPKEQHQKNLKERWHGQQRAHNFYPGSFQAMPYGAYGYPQQMGGRFAYPQQQQQQQQQRGYPAQQQGQYNQQRAVAGAQVARQQQQVVPQQPRPAAAQRAAPAPQSRPAGAQPAAKKAAAPATKAQQAAPDMHQAPSLNPQILSSLSPAERKHALGTALFPLVLACTGQNTERAAKVTGMILELDSTDILELTDDQSKLQQKVNEALAVLREHDAGKQKQQQ
jgi:polyadenylate-binding protein